MREIDFRDVDDPEEYIRELFPDASQEEIMETHLAIAELLNLLWDIHMSQVASAKNYYKVNSRGG